MKYLPERLTTEWYSASETVDAPGERRIRYAMLDGRLNFVVTDEEGDPELDGYVDQIGALLWSTTPGAYTHLSDADSVEHFAVLMRQLWELACKYSPIPSIEG